jgi:glycosyltransferase involved in cell wall biosynthesis
MTIRIDVFVPTYRRPEMLRALLLSLQRQEVEPGWSVRIVVVDNDSERSAESIVAAMDGQGPFRIYYDQEPRQGLCHARNRCLALFEGDWLAFVDDDTVAVDHWLAGLVRTALVHHADIVMGPMLSALPPDTPNWIVRGKFFDQRKRFPTGTVTHGHAIGGNMLLAGGLIRRAGRGFDHAFNLTGGEDSEYVDYLESIGARSVFSDEAVVIETVRPSRTTLRWLVQRHFRGGQDFARRFLRRSSFLDRMKWFFQRVFYIFISFFGVFLFFPIGVHISAYFLLKLVSNIAHLSALFGVYYEEYSATKVT